jgi:hypothetical protein
MLMLQMEEEGRLSSQRNRSSKDEVRLRNLLAEYRAAPIAPLCARFQAYRLDIM